MNKLTKVGLSALCGSLAAASAAYAGEVSDSGGATASYQSTSKRVTGNPIGINTGLTFTGSGELDNGATFTLSLNHTDQVAWSGAQIAITLPGLGTIRIDNGTGTADSQALAWYNKGFIFPDGSEKAMKCFDKAIKSDPGFVDAWINKGYSLHHLGKHEESVVCIRRALELDPNHEYALSTIKTFGYEEYFK